MDDIQVFYISKAGLDLGKITKFYLEFLASLLSFFLNCSI